MWYVEVATKAYYRFGCMWKGCKLEACKGGSNTPAYMTSHSSSGFFAWIGGEAVNIVEPLRSKDDIEAMKDYLRDWSHRNYILFLVGLNTGLRVGDILKLKVKDVQGWHIKVREQKTGKSKSIKMTRTLKNELRDYVKDKPLHHYLFQSRNGVNKPLDRRTVYWILKAAGSELGIDNIGTHTMRKTFGYWYYQKYKNVADLMAIFNHSSPAITLIYIGIRQDDLDRKMSTFNI